MVYISISPISRVQLLEDTDGVLGQSVSLEFIYIYLLRSIYIYIFL